MFIEVKQVGRAVAGDRQLFEYCFHQGVPLCVLTDGREWSFYLPGGLGSYEDRRIYRLQIDDREPAKCEQMLQRYLSRERVRDQTAFEDAQRDHRDAARRREATGVLPRAWRELTAEAHEQLLEALTDKTEALCGYKPAQDEVIRFLRALRSGPPLPSEDHQRGGSQVLQSQLQPSDDTLAKPGLGSVGPSKVTPTDKSVTYILHGQHCTAANASLALVEILRAIVAGHEDRLPELARAVSGTKVNHIGRSPEEINPAKPHLARAVEIAPGWSVGLNISNRTKLGIIRTTCELLGMRMPEDLEVQLPNAD